MIRAGAAGKSVLAERYELIREVGSGGMATVYLAEDRKHGRQVAVKVLKEDLSAAIGADRFAREIRLVARLQHPHILPLFDSGEADGLLFFVMPYIEGESLRERLSRTGSLSLAETAAIIRQIADALDYAHARGIVHRDIKPGNILMSAGQALLADFGVARSAAKVGLESLTVAGTALGTPAYMSPEQACGDENIDARSDLYSLGCVCYEMLSGAPPFRGDSTVAIMSQHVVRSAPRLAGKRERLADDVVDTVSRTLSKDPADRPATAGDFATLLEEAAIRARRPSAGDERLRALEQDREKRKTVFVLDFTNITGAAEIDWLATGIAETVGVDLKKIAGIQVVGSDSATRQRVAAIRRKGPLDAATARELGTSIGARWVVWGGFQQSGSSIRLTPHFGDTETGEIISAEKIDGDMQDIFALQDRIVTGLADVLRIELTSTEVAEIERPQTTKLTAYASYAKGQQAFQLFGRESARIATEHFRQALEIDPSYALAWASLGGLLMPKYIASGSNADLDEGITALQRAMELDPTLGEPYAFLAYMYGRQHRHDEAIAAARTAIDREPGSYMGWYLLGVTLGMRAFERGIPTDLALAIPPLLRAGAINPQFHPAWMMSGDMYVLRGQYAHAVKVLDKAMAVEREGTGFIFLGSYVQRAEVHIYSDEHDAAESLLELAIATYPKMDHVYAETMTAYAHFIRGILYEQRGNDAAAEKSFRASCQVAEANDHRLGIGAHWIKSKFGLARTAYRRADEGASNLALLEALQMHAKRPRFVWGFILGSADAATQYQAAAAHAVRGESADCLTALRAAADLGWADLNQLSHDRAFAVLREHAEFRELASEAGSRVTLPPPAGSGGLPDFTSAHPA